MKWTYNSTDREAAALPRDERKRDAKNPDAKLPVHPDYQKEEDEIYRRTHAAMAEFAFDHIVSLQGLWIKMGQYMGSRPGRITVVFIYFLF